MANDKGLTMRKSHIHKVKKCRVCGKRKLRKLLSLGNMPMVNNFLTAYQLDEPEDKLPLTVIFCENCGLVLTREVVDPKIMYKNYVYISSFSKTMLNHFELMAKALVKRFNLDARSLVVEMGSNDGTLLKSFKKTGVGVLGVDPAENLANVANREGVETLNEFFNLKTARVIAKERGKVDLIVGTNVFAHINDLDDIIKGIKVLLSDHGAFVFECPYLVDLVNGVQFDTIYHEHLSYYSLAPLIKLFERFRMEIFDVERWPVHGGSLRVFVRRAKGSPVSKNVADILKLEEESGVNSYSTLLKFAGRVRKIKKDLISLLSDLKSHGKRVVGFGAPAKGNILLNYCGVGLNYLDYVTDNIPYKHGLYTPGKHLQVFPEEKLLEDKPDYLLLLPWNFKEEILAKLDGFRKAGGRVIIPIPEVVVV